MGKMQRTKGRRGEQEVVNILKDAGVPAVRMGMAETGGVLKEDILVAGVWKAEVKIGSHVPKFIYDAMKEGEVFLIMKRDRSKWKVCMDLDFFLEKFIA